MIAADPGREREALDWARRIADPEFADWEEHLLWLERDEGNAEAFDRACVAMEVATQGLSPAVAMASMGAADGANDNVAAGGRRSRWLWRFAVAGGAIAASMAGLLLMQPSREQGAMQVIATAPGVVRTVAMVDGTRVTLNGNSRIKVAQGSKRGVTILTGEAYFDVVHDDRRPFEVRAGNMVVRDVGTSFDVALDAGTLRVSVREGEVALGTDAAVRLKAGQSARVDRGGGIVRSVLGDPASAGGWRQGRLVYRDAPLSDVVADLGRSLGTPVSLDPGITTRRFTGVITIDVDHDLTVRRLAASAGLMVGREGAGWHLARR